MTKKDLLFIKDKPLKAILMDQVSIHPYRVGYKVNTIKNETSRKVIKPSIRLVFGNGSNRFLDITCNSGARNSKEIYFLDCQTILDEEHESTSRNAFLMNGEEVKALSLYKSKNSSESEETEEGNQKYSSILIEFRNDRFLAIIGKIDEEYYYPEIDMQFFNESESEKYKKTYLKDLKLQKKYFMSELFIEGI